MKMRIFNMTNVAVITGRLTRDVELKAMNNGENMGRFTVAVDRNFKNASGEREADFIRCVAFRKTAELISEYFNKGSQISLDGRIQTGSFENDKGETVYTTDLVVNNFSFVGSSSDSSDESSSLESNKEIEIDPDDLPF